MSNWPQKVHGGDCSNIRAEADRGQGSVEHKHMKGDEQSGEFKKI